MLASLLIAAAFAAGPAPLQTTPAATGQEAPPRRVRSILLYGDEACPKPAAPDEIVVCANAGESPYRIPKRFREQPDQSPKGTAWTRRMETVEEIGAASAGLPGSCSPVGVAAQTGCTRKMIQQWAQERLDREAKEAREMRRTDIP